MIPLAKDTREAIGTFAEKVENRSLLFEKMVLAKTWGHQARFNDANRFNVLRASTHGRILLEEDSHAANRKAQRGGKNSASDAYKATVAGALAAGQELDAPHLAKRQVESANHFLSALETAYSGRVKTFVGTLGGRLLINMAGGVMENAGLALDRCFGLPYIPGSAVKGITRNVALWHIRNCSKREDKIEKLGQALLVFGFIEQDIGRNGHFRWAVEGDSSMIDDALADTGVEKVKAFKGLISFLEAKPTDINHLNIVAEVITPHPRGGDPRPLFFPAVEAHSSFGFALLIQRQFRNIDAAPLLQTAESWLKEALTKNGIGAKTGSGYGWFEIDPAAEVKRRAEMAEAARLAEIAEQKAIKEEKAKQQEAARLAALSPKDLAREAIHKMDDQTFAAFAKSLTEKTEHEQRAFLEVLKGKDYKTKRKNWQKKKPDIWDPVQSVAQQLNIDL